ncbi:Uncharacterised protein [Mycobacteroides abscessus subsp. abscessus]|nr:Uncharacterised protein [Mycobacteroides abscessus subsp. abscessus]
MFVDTERGTETWWDAGDHAVGEPIHLPGAEHAYWGTLATDRRDMSSWFHIVRVPAGLHGTWVPAAG